MIRSLSKLLKDKDDEVKIGRCVSCFENQTTVNVNGKLVTFNNLQAAIGDLILVYGNGMAKKMRIRNYTKI